ncbi:MAG: hypothetical protein WCG98_09875 [bacterium]
MPPVFVPEIGKDILDRGRREFPPIIVDKHTDTTLDQEISVHSIPLQKDPILIFVETKTDPVEPDTNPVEPSVENNTPKPPID